VVPVFAPEEVPIHVDGPHAAPERRKRVTLLEVARHAGVSHQTVSRYLRHNGGLKPATVAKIDAAVLALGYRPDLIARSLRTRRSNRLAIVLPELTWFVPGALRGASAAAHDAGYQIDVVSLEGDEFRRRERVLALLDSERVEGILSLTPLGGMLPDSDPAAGAAVVVVGEYDDKMRSTGVFADGRYAAGLVEHLAGLGHRQFLHVAGAADWASARNRRAVYLRTVQRLGLESYGVVEGDWSVRSGYEAARDLPADAGVTAVFAANDHVAFGVVRGLQDRGLRVPQDVSVVGWDDEQFGRYTSPTLTTVSVDRELLGRQAMESLIADVQGRERPRIPDLPPGRLVLRGSSGPAPGA
jgi:LacI family repressor for deo operon, udp, cdd, tsx, nupC, and nupG